MTQPRIVSSAKVEPITYAATDRIRAAVREVARTMRWGAVDNGESAFERAIPAGARVLVKPNWVLHYNQGPWGIEPLITHAAIIRVVVEEALASGASQVSVGDAPIQDCDFERLIEASGIAPWADALRAREPRFRGPLDYRRTKSVTVGGVRHEREGLVPLDRFVTFDLGTRSLLEPISGDGRFRVTLYPPAEMARTHHAGKHQYLVARDIIEANVVINLPKLKTHKKAGITCALKNLIGINGNKEFLPHHRLGGSQSGGDCYPGNDPVKRVLEFAFDQSNSTHSIAARKAWRLGKRVLDRLLHERGDEIGVEGAWSGNDTIWRTCLDLNRILLRGRADGTMADTDQRRALHLVDAVVAGQGDGPLNAEPFPLGYILGGDSAAAVDYVGSLLLGYQPSRIPIVAHAFDRFEWPLVDFEADEVRVTGALGEGRAANLAGREDAPRHYPAGWRDAVLDAMAARG